MGQLHIFFFPMLAQGHMIPVLDMAKLFASRGVKATIITTPLFAKSIEKTKHFGLEIGSRIIKFPGPEVGLPEGCESLDQVKADDDTNAKFFKATALLQEPLEQLLQECQPNCLVADMFFPWATESAAKFDIPRLVFHGTSYFALCASDHLRRYKPFKNVSSDSDSFVMPCFPHQVKFTRKQVPDYDIKEVVNDFTELLKRVRESETTSYGVIVNSFYELEPEYADHYRKSMGRRAWNIGPLSICNRDVEDKAQRGKESSIDEHECLKWLDSKKPNSVLYVCFGSMANFTANQLHEIALGLEASGQQFIWVVRNTGREEEEEEKQSNWLPEGFEERMKEKGLIIRGWAPQVLILDHEATGAFVTHCGWNSTLEGVCAGVPMVTWPGFAEQFFNEKLVTEVLKIGVPVGAQQWNRVATDGVKREAVAKAVERVMVGEEAEEMRSRAKALKQMARQAVEEGGSSHSDLNALIEELSAYHSLRNPKSS